MSDLQESLKTLQDTLALAEFSLKDETLSAQGVQNFTRIAMMCKDLI